MAHPQIAAFARLAEENAAPTRLLAGQATLLSRTMHDIRYDAIHDEILVTNPFAKAVLVFRGDANGEEAPIRIIQGPSTQLGPNTDRLDVDPVHNEIIVNTPDAVLVYPREATGDVAPIRVIQGPDTELVRAKGVAVDPVNNVIVVGLMKEYGDTTIIGKDVGGLGGLLVFGRTDNGNVKPKGIIRGLSTGIYIAEQLQVYPPRGWIVISQATDWAESEPEDTFIGVWSIHDKGDVPPRWKIGGPKSTIKKPRGVALDPKHKELIVADMRLNSVLTYYFPEMF